MITFGRRRGVMARERRGVSREQVDVSGTVVTAAGPRTVALLNVSQAGAMLRGDSLPRPGCGVWIKVGPIDILTTVVWHRDDFCGVTFDGVLSDKQLEFVRRAGRASLFASSHPHA